MANPTDEEIKLIESQDTHDVKDVVATESHEEDGKNLADEEKKAN